MSSMLSAAETLEREFLQIRARILELAALLDRVDRGAGNVADDPRRQAIADGLAVAAGPGPHRAEQVQLVFSRPYDPQWRRNLGLEN